MIERHGPGAVAFYLSGQLLTEDYYVANKLMKGFIGSANVDTNSRLCMASSVAGHRRAFGSDTVPGMYEDLDTADLIVLVGSNTAWCHPVLFQRMIANKRERGARIVVIDPRRTATADEADLFLPIAAGTDTALFCGLLCDLAAHGAIDFAYINAHTRGFGAAYARATEIARTIENTAAATGLAAADVARFFEWFRTTPRVVTAFSQGVNQSAQGTDKVNAIINCHLATGRIGKLGMGPFSLTGQPNAMGGREVGGLANQLAAHMSFTPADIDRVGRFWRATRMATHEGLKAVQMFEAIERGEIKALWVMATNPAVSLPRAAAVRAALRRLDVFVASENVLSNDTVDAGAQILLPAAAWGEKDGTVTNSERRISRQRSFLPPPGQAQPDWWIVCEVARRMGFGAAFSYGSVADVFREHAALSAFENGGARDFDIGGLANITDDEYNAFDPVQWPIRANETGGARASTTRFFAAGGFYTGDHKARFVAPEPPPHPAMPLDEAFPFRLNTGRIRDQWHTMTRTGTSPRLGAHLPEPFVAVHPDDARAAGLSDGGFARVATHYGACVLKVAVTDAQMPGTLFVPIHWSGATSSGGRVGELVTPLTDPHSGQPDSEGDAGRDQRRHVFLARLHPDAAQGHAAGRHLVGAGRRARRPRPAVCRRSLARRMARLRGPLVRRGRRTRRVSRCAGRQPASRRLRRRETRRLHLRRPAQVGAAVGCGQGDVRGRCDRERTPPHAAVRPVDRRRRRCRADDLRLLRRRPQHHSPRHRVREAGERRGDRQSLARRHQLRLMPAGVAQDRPGGGRAGVAPSIA